MVISDVLIIGSGIAALSLAIKLNNQFPDRKIYVVTKGDALESNTRYAQGGFSVACDPVNDSFEKHIEDTLKAGDGLCDKRVVEKVIRYGKKALFDLTTNGVDFDKNSNGDFILGKEGGHSQARIVHYKDMTGLQIAVSLLVKVKTIPAIILLSHHTAIDLITDRQIRTRGCDAFSCYGAFILNNKTNSVEKILARITVLATGGIGQVYRSTTNPPIATGDGIAMAYRAGAAIRNMEFIQFHPTALYSGVAGARTFLISEALRGYGAFLKNYNGQRFMFKYAKEGELACRDIVARAVEIEIKMGGQHCVFVDCTHLPSDQVKNDFPTIHSYCLAQGIDITTDLIPVIPAAHYLCGGIQVDDSARTTINNLYALGECADTGLHGANRLASNSLLEAVAFAEFCFQDICRAVGQASFDSAVIHSETQYSIEQMKSSGPGVLKGKVRYLMTKYAGVNRTNRGLEYARGYLELMDARLQKVFPDAISPELLELRNMIITSKLIIDHSLNRKVNKGAFYNIDLDVDYALDSNEQTSYL